MDRIQLSPKQIEYLGGATHRWNLKTGAVRSGKSFVDTAAVIPRRLIERSGLNGINVILGVSRETIERNILEPMREIYTDKRIGMINSRNVAMMFGEPVYCLGAEKVSQVAKIQGASIKYAYGDEIAKWNELVFQMLKSRLDKPYSCFDGACNPESPTHWLKKFIDDPEIDLYLQKYTLFDNPFLPADFVDQLCKEYAGTVFYDRLIMGDWALAQGLIYPMYKDAVADPPGEPQQYYVSCDYGTQNATVFLLWGQIGGVWYCLREYYYSGRTEMVQKTDSEYADDLTRWLGGIEPVKIIVDPAAASFIAELKQRGYRIKRARNDVLDGIRFTAAQLANGTIKINPVCRNLLDEAASYVWDDKAVEDRPVKVKDHAMDAMRYMAYTIIKPGGGLSILK